VDADIERIVEVNKQEVQGGAGGGRGGEKMVEGTVGRVERKLNGMLKKYGTSSRLVSTVVLK